MGEKKWTLKEAREDYMKSNVSKLGVKSCNNCEFANKFAYLSCDVQGIGVKIYLPILRAHTCKYYTEQENK